MNVLARRLFVLLGRWLAKLHAFVEAKHGWTLLAYGVLCLAVVPRLFPGTAHYLSERLHLGVETQSSLVESVEAVAHGATYVWAGVTALVLLLLALVRYLFDPVAGAVEFDLETLGADLSVVEQTLPAGPAKLNELVGLGDEAFAAWGGTREERTNAYAKFMEANPRVFSLVRRKGNTFEQGFSCVLPLNEDAFRRFRLGIQDSWELSAADILPESMLPAQFLCLNSIYLRRDIAREPRARAVSLLCRHIAIFIRSRDGSMAQPLLVAEGLTRRGREFLERYGFTSVYTSRDHLPLYELDLSRPAIMNDKAKTFERYLRVAFSELN